MVKKSVIIEKTNEKIKNLQDSCNPSFELFSYLISSSKNHPGIEKILNRIDARHAVSSRKQYGAKNITFRYQTLLMNEW